MDDERRYYIYGWFNNDWGVYFYVGKGTRGRYEELKSRSKAFMAIYDNWNCEPIILDDGLNEIEAYEAETQIKQKFIFEMGHPIIDGEYKEANRISQREGIERARLEGKYKGRKEVSIPDFSKHYDRYMSREISKPKLAAELKISRVTLDKLIKQHEANTK